MTSNPCNTCGTEIYVQYDEPNDESYEMCPKCEYEDIPKWLKERFPEFRKINGDICEHFNWRDNCKGCGTGNGLPPKRRPWED